VFDCILPRPQRAVQNARVPPPSRGGYKRAAPRAPPQPAAPRPCGPAALAFTTHIDNITSTPRTTFGAGAAPGPRSTLDLYTRPTRAPDPGIGVAASASMPLGMSGSIGVGHSASSASSAAVEAASSPAATAAATVTCARGVRVRGTGRGVGVGCGDRGGGDGGGSGGGGSGSGGGGGGEGSGSHPMGSQGKPRPSGQPREGRQTAARGRGATLLTR
jgi:hypothetical protein